MSRILEIEKNLFQWFKANNYKGHDPYQLDEKASSLIRRLPVLKYARRFMKPFHVFIPKATFTSFPKIYHPTALGMIIGGNAFLYGITGNAELLQSSKELIKLLKELRNKSYKHFAWGSPFEWGSNTRNPVNTPAVCLVSPIGNCILDYFEISKDAEALELCKSIAMHIIEENGYRVIDDHSICLNYSPADRLEVYNSNALAAKLLFRLSSYNGNHEMASIAMKICRFVIDGQQPNGSWVYSKTSDVIDNRHTGFILESLAAIRSIWSNDLLDKVYFLGVDYYTKNLLADGLPKWSPKKTFPIDIHDVGQSIITLTDIGNIHGAQYIANFAIDSMSNGKDEFYFKYFKNGRVNQNVFIRWGQAWMYYSIGKMLFYDKKND